MQIIINDLSTGKCLCRKHYSAEFIPARGIEETEGSISCTTARISYCESCFEGMRIVWAETGQGSTGSLYLETDKPFYLMAFCMEGHLKISSPDHDIMLKERQCIFKYIPTSLKGHEISKSGKTISIQLTERCYQRLTNNEDIGALTASQPALLITPAMEMILRSLGEFRDSALMRRIFLETGVLQLLMMLLEGFRTEKPPANAFLKSHDVERLRYARTLIEENINKPYSLIELARKAGLNDFKLKKGFKELFGTTVFGYLHEIRMEKARKMLWEEKKTVAEVSLEVGYKNPHHFTSAFKKKFGILPGQLNR